MEAPHKLSISTLYFKNDNLNFTWYISKLGHKCKFKNLGNGMIEQSSRIGSAFYSLNFNPWKLKEESGPLANVSLGPIGI